MRDDPRPGCASVPALLAGRELVEVGRWSDAKVILQHADQEYIPTHDGMRNLNARIQDSVYLRFGRREGDRIAYEAYDRMTQWDLDAAPDQQPDFQAQVIAMSMLWHWHRTPFRLVEDDERVTYVMQPCGSGGRLANEGAYLPSSKRPLSLLDTPSFASFSEPDFPNWCAHCAFSNRGYLSRAIPYLVLEGWTPHRRWGGCAAHTYKSIDLVPAEAFERVGLEPAGPRSSAPQGRVFTEAELVELARPVCDRILEAVECREGDRAIDLIDQSWAAWTGLHHAYRCLFSMFVSEVTIQHGADVAADLVDQSAWEVVAPVVENGYPSKIGWARFWRNHLGLAQVDGDDQDPVLSVAASSLVHPDLDPPSRIALAERLTVAITDAARQNGHSETFGTMRCVGERFEHVLPQGI